MAEASGWALVTRETNMPWLIERFREDGLILKWRVAGQFIEASTRVSSPFLASTRMLECITSRSATFLS